MNVQKDMRPEDIKYDTPIKVTIIQYNNIMKKCCGLVAGRRDSDGNYWIKVWMMKHVDYIAQQFKL